MFSITPEPYTALDQTPAQPSPLQLLRLVEALYYASSSYRDTGSPVAFDQLDGRQTSRYYQLAQYLLARRARPQARPVTQVDFERRLLAYLATTATATPGQLMARGEHEFTAPPVVAFLLDNYSIEPAYAADLAQRWLATRPVFAVLPW